MKEVGELVKVTEAGLSLLVPTMFILLCFGFCFWSAKCFHNKRRFLGTALVGCGLLCNLWAWSLTAGK